MLKVNLKTYTGHYLSIGDASTSHRLSAQAQGVGSGEIFTLIPASGTNASAINSGDQVHLQTHHGRYVMARDGGGGTVSGEAALPNVWETFTVEKLDGGGEIVAGDRVTLRANNNRNYLMARNGGGGEVTAESSNRREWETFIMESWNAMPIRLRAYDTHFLTAEDGGGREITATRNYGDTWETFTLINRSRFSGGREGDAVCLQGWDGRFIAAEDGGGGDLRANRTHAASWETFTMQKVGGGAIATGDKVSFRTHNGVNYVMAVNGGNGIILASSRQAREWETFQLVRFRRSLQEVYDALRATLGNLTGSEVLLSGGRGRYQLCAHGIIIEDPQWGAFAVQGEIYQKFLSLSSIQPGTAGFLDEQLRLLGYPRSDVRELGNDGSAYCSFERGLIVSRPDPVSAVVYGEFYEAWRWSAMAGYPRLDRLPTPDGSGAYQLCDNGATYQSGVTGAHAISGDVWKLWERWTRGLDHDPDRSRPEFSDPLLTLSPPNFVVNPALGYPTGEEQSAPEGGRIQQFEFGSIAWRVTETPRLRFFAQNMALLPPPATYLGTERERAIQALINHLRENQYEVVGLSECFVNGERDRIWNALRDLYSARLDGPDEEDLESDGGLLLMGRYPMTEYHQTIYRQCAGPDCIANKGVLHARLQIPGLATGFDVFLSHTQNPDEAGGVNVLKQQWAHLSSFIRAYSSPERPAFLMGDLNTDAFNTALFREFRRQLDFPLDLWLTSGDGSRGITIDQKRSFHNGSPTLLVNDPERYLNGQRVDYLLSWLGLRYLPQFHQTRVMHLQSSVAADGTGRDLSDHYGLVTEMTEMREVTVEVRRPITGVQVEMVGFRCLEVTQGFAEATKRSNPDEPFFELRGRTATGASQSTRSPIYADIDNGEIRTFSRRVLTFGDPGAALDLQVTGWEYDPWPDDNEDLGTQGLRLTRCELLRLWGGAMTRVLPLLTDDNSQYAVTVRISVS